MELTFQRNRKIKIMRLWTVQNERVYDDFLAKGKPYRVVNEHTMPWYWSDTDEPDAEIYPYRWMASQLALKAGPPPEGVEFPVWAWKKVDGHDDGKPDMRRWRTTYVEQVVRLQLEIPEEKVLLSDFDNWHIPLNLGYFSKTEAETDEFDKWAESIGVERLRKNTLWTENPTEAELTVREKILESWKRCLELEPTPTKGYDPEWMGNWQDDYIQAVFWEILPEYIVTVERFTTRLHAGAKEVQARDAQRKAEAAANGRNDDI